ncbi:MAG TPA: hypothetical protein VMU28_04630 [Terriglobales bacterium]|nr:hypothetical protein [Terriglobales bacterium]
MSLGITIHFRGQLKSEDCYSEVIRVAQREAFANEWLTEPIENPETELLRIDEDEKESTYVGPTKGLVVYPHEDCEPVRLEFDRELGVQEFTKTQFAGAAIHIKVVEFLRKLEPYFDSFHVEDEGEFWNTSDETILQDHLTRTAQLIEEYRAKDPRNEVKVRTPDGRIADLIAYKSHENGPEGA